MTIKHLIAGAVVTVAVTSALVLGSAVGAQAQIFPTPTPINPPSTNLPIYTQPSYPGFHVPAQILAAPGSKFPLKPRSYGPHAYTALPTCSTLFPSVFYSELSDAGYALTTDHSVRATQDPQLLSVLASAISVSCDFANASTGRHFDVTLAVYANDAAANARLDALGYSAASGAGGRTKYFAASMRTEIQVAAVGQGGWSLVSYDGPVDLGDLSAAVGSVFQDINIY
ncbi:MAG: hypothetical protein ABIP33_07775 [Pseudolysinimonas sp.]